MNCFEKVVSDWKYALGWIAISIFIVAILVAVYVGVLAYKTSVDIPYASNVISVTGTAEVVAAPDVATFNFTVTEVAESVEKAQEIASSKINQATDYLKENGVSEEDLKTQSYNVYPKYEWKNVLCITEPCPSNQELVGYEVSQSTRVKVRDTGKAGELLAGIGGIGVTYVSGLSFTIDDPDALQEEARSEAIEDAKAKADLLVDELGVKIVRVVDFSDYTDDPSYYLDSYDFRTAEAFSPTISPGERTIFSEVYITYEIR